MTDNRNDPKRARWWQVSLRTAFVVMAAFAILFAFAANRARQQSQAVKNLRARGYYVWYDYHFPAGLDEGWAGESAEPPIPDWLSNTLGVDWFCDAIFVSGGAVDCIDSDFICMQQLHQLRDLSLHRTSVTSAQLRFLANCKQLEKLHLANTGIGDDGLLHLRGLTALRKLYLNETHVTDAGVWELQGALPHCEIIR